MKQSISDDTTRRTSGFVSDVVQRYQMCGLGMRSRKCSTGDTYLVSSITSIDELQNSVNGLDGMVYPSSQTTPPIIHLTLSEFQDRLRWHRNDDMSERIGRIFCDSPDATPYKVLCAYHSSSTNWLLVDTRYASARKDHRWKARRRSQCPFSSDV